MSADAGVDLPGMARRALDAFAESASRRRDRDSLMDNAFAALFDLYRTATPAQLRSPAGLEFNATLAELLVSGNNPARLSLYVVRSQTAAENGQHEAYRPACWRRSMLELLGEEFVPWRDFLSPVDLEAVARVDEALVEVAGNARPVSDEEVPAWVPESHWWWWEPARQRGEDVPDVPEPRDSGTLDAVAD